jgi:alpha-galactosidase
MDFNVNEWIENAFSFNRPLQSQFPLPFSLRIAKKQLNQILSRLTLKINPPQKNGPWMLQEIKYTDSVTNIEWAILVKSIQKEGAVDLVMHITNRGTQRSPILGDIQIFDFPLHPFLPFREKTPDQKSRNDFNYKIHHSKGSYAAKDDFAPSDAWITTNHPLKFAPKGGRSSNTTILPFFHVETPGIGGLFIGIGWSGQWKGTLVKNKQGEINFQVGMAHTHLSLNPGESIRTPRILLFPWRGDTAINGHNAFRRFFLQYYAPHYKGKLVQLPLACYGVRNWRKRGDEANFFTDENQKDYADGMAPYGPEVFWIDAGWFEGRWPDGVGSWIVRKDGFPNGLRPITDYIKRYNMKLLLWFEPERVHINSWLDQNHPDWSLTLPRNKNRLLDLGNKEARQWLIDHLTNMIRQEGISIFRLDFNQDPLPFWKKADPRDRQGVHEIRHIEGLYQMWDTLQQRFPELILDNCASGGRRLDLESMSRCVALTRTDYAYFEPNGPQCHTAAVNLYLPTTSTFTDDPTPYKIRSVMTNGMMLDWDPFKEGFDVLKAKAVLDEFRQTRDFYLADFYPLTPYNTSDAVWCAFQFHNPETEKGIVVVFRRALAPDQTIFVDLHGLAAMIKYRLVISDDELTKTTTEILGDKLMRRFSITIMKAPGSLLIQYSVVP